MVVDHYSDKGSLLGLEIVEAPPEGLPKEAYAWEEARLFPLHTSKDALLSALYFEKQAEQVPEEVGLKIAQALKVYGLEEEFQKVAAELTQEKREELPDEVYGLVYKDPKTGEKVRKFPMPDAEHVRKAVQFFDKAKIPEDKKEELAKKILAKAKEFGVEVQDESVLKYAGMGKSNLQKAAQLIREFRVYPLHEDELARNAYEVVATAFEKTASVSEEELEEAVHQLEEIDKLFKVSYSKLPPPRLLVYNEKLAEETVSLAGEQVPVSVLEAIPDEVYEDLIGSTLDRSNLKAEIEALPKPEQELLLQFIQKELNTE